jgi:hypothetical protein
MTDRIWNWVVIRATHPDKCEMCGAVVELRPYGPGGMWVCFECGMKDEAEAERQFARLLGLEPEEQE